MATLQFVQGRVEAKDRKLVSKSEREFNIEEEHKVRRPVDVLMQGKEDSRG